MGEKGVEGTERSKVTIEHEPLGDAPKQTEDGKGIPGLKKCRQQLEPGCCSQCRPAETRCERWKNEVEEQDSCQPSVDDGKKRCQHAPKEVENDGWRDLAQEEGVDHVILSGGYLPRHVEMDAGRKGQIGTNTVDASIYYSPRLFTGSDESMRSFQLQHLMSTNLKMIHSRAKVT